MTVTIFRLAAFHGKQLEHGIAVAGTVGLGNLLGQDLIELLLKHLFCTTAAIQRSDDRDELFGMTASGNFMVEIKKRLAVEQGNRKRFRRRIDDQ